MNELFINISSLSLSPVAVLPESLLCSLSVESVAMGITLY